MPAVADTAPLHTILFGDLPLLVAREFARLVMAAPDLRLVGPVVRDAELASQICELRPSVIIAVPSQLAMLSQVAKSARVLLYSAAGTAELLQFQEGHRWCLSGIIEPLPHLLAERASWRQTLLQKLRLAAVGLAASPRLLTRTLTVPPPSGLVIIGASTGGPSAVETLLAQLRADSQCAIVVAVHLPQSFTASFVARLRRKSALPVVAAGAGSRLLAGQVLVVPGGTNMVVRRGVGGHWSTCLAPEPAAVGSDIPSVDILMSSAATAANRAMGVVLTGLGRDGTRGARAIQENGGQVLVQDAASAAVFSMPGAVLRAGWASAALPLAGLAAAINDFGRQPLETTTTPARRAFVTTAHAA
jgi:two-component system chemotaxis response regulator CheB